MKVSIACMVVGSGSQIDGAKALRLGFQLSLFPLSIWSLPSQYWYLHLREEKLWSKEAWIWTWAVRDLDDV